MPAAEEEGVEERTLAKVLKGPDQPTAAELGRAARSARTRALRLQEVVPTVRQCTWGWPAAPEGSTRRRRATNVAP
eukprot:5000335-Amphidinium_carterae.1